MIERIANKLRKVIDYYSNKRDMDTRMSEYMKLFNNYHKYKKIKLHFGCGPRILNNWINIDLVHQPFEKYPKDFISKYYPESIRGTKDDFYAIDVLKTGLPLPDNSVDLIFHEDFLEHLDQKEQIVFLAETLRVMKPGSIHRVNTPELMTSMNKHSNFKEGKEGVNINEWIRHGHKNVLTNGLLEEMAKMVGYSSIVFNNKDKSISKEIPLESRPGDDRSENGNIFADLIK